MRGDQHMARLHNCVRLLVASAIQLPLALPAAAAPGTDSESAIKKAGQACAGGDAKACKELEAAALREKNFQTRALAVRLCSNQALLEEVARKDPDSRVRTGAIGKLTNQEVLAAIARVDTDLWPRVAATALLDDQVLLAELARHDPQPEVRKAAVGKVKDQAVVADVARHDTESSVRYHAMERVEDQAVLAEIAVMDKNERLGREALLGMTDLSLVGRLTGRDIEAKAPNISALARIRIVLAHACVVKRYQAPLVLKPAYGGVPMSDGHGHRLFLERLLLEVTSAGGKLGMLMFDAVFDSAWDALFADGEHDKTKSAVVDFGKAWKQLREMLDPSVVECLRASSDQPFALPAEPD